MNTSIERRLVALEQQPQPDTARCVQVAWECAACDWSLLYECDDVSIEVCAEVLAHYGLDQVTPADRVYLLVTVRADVAPQLCSITVATDPKWCASGWFPPAGEPTGLVTWCVPSHPTPYLFWHLRGAVVSWLAGE